MLVVFGHRPNCHRGSPVWRPALVLSDFGPAKWSSNLSNKSLRPIRSRFHSCCKDQSHSAETPSVPPSPLASRQFPCRVPATLALRNPTVTASLSHRQPQRTPTRPPPEAEPASRTSP